MRPARLIRLCLVLLSGLMGSGCQGRSLFGDEEATLAPCRVRVFEDRNGNGEQDEEDVPVVGVAVFYEDRRHALTDAEGCAALPDANQGIVWVRSERRHGPGPHWAPLSASPDETARILLPLAEHTGPLAFVVGADTHAGIEVMSVDDQLLGLSQAAKALEELHFVAIAGDITQANQPEHFDTIQAAIDVIDLPFVPIPGNHDWYDGGEAYREHFGPPTYSFDAGGAHVVVLNDASSEKARLDFLDLDLALRERDEPVLLFMHAPPRESLRLALEERDITLLFTGHMHSNRILQHDTFVEVNTQPLVMGGIDLSPAGFRVVELTGKGLFDIHHRTTLNQPILAALPVARPLPAASGDPRLRVAAALPGSSTSVLAWVDEGEPVALKPVGGWVYESPPVAALSTPGPHRVRVQARSPSTDELTITTRVEDPLGLPRRRERGPAPEEAWPLFQGDASHRGTRNQALLPPLEAVWASAVGGHVHGGSPVISGGTTVVSVADFGSGLGGGVVALDVESGAKRWEARLGFSVRNAPALGESTVLVVSSDGTVHGLDLETGESLYTYELAPGFPTVQRSLYSSPTLVDGVAYVGGRHEFVAMEIRSGEILWRTETKEDFGDLSSHASPAIGGGLVVVPFNRKDGLYAFEQDTGAIAWHRDASIVQATHGSPVVDGDRVYVVNELSLLSALDLQTGETLWSVRLEGDTFGWGYLSESTPVVAGTRILVGTQRGTLHAVDATTGRVVWRAEALPSLLRATHYHGESPAITAAPVVAGEVVWLPGQDGILRALDAVTGEPLWEEDLGVPMASSPALYGDTLIVASYDGSVRAMRSRR